MNLLLDTHAFIWLDIAPNRLSNAAKHAIQNSQNSIYLSLTSVWEMQIKIQLGKLKLNSPLSSTVAAQQNINSVQMLPIRLDHILALDNLPFHHRDPFDRLLVAQAQIEGLTLITNDQKINAYAVTCLW